MSFFHYNQNTVKISQPLTEIEKQTITSKMPQNDFPIQIMFKSDARFNKVTRPSSIVAMTSHFVKLFNKGKKGETICFGSFHISEVLLIASNNNEFCVVQTKQTNLTITAPECLEFAQLLYRNCILSYNYLTPQESVEVQATIPSQFPQITVELSPSQTFQFAYFAACAEEDIPYNHEVVRYFHNLVLSKNCVLDISQLPLNLNSSTKDLIPIIASVKSMQFICGICCCEMNRPEALTAFAPLLATGSNIHIVHFEKCGIKQGLNLLLDQIRKNPQLKVQYWNLSNNPIMDLNLLPEILSYSQFPVYYVNLSYCGVMNSTTENLFKVFTSNKNFLELRHLYIAGIQITNLGARHAFEDYLKATVSQQDQPCKLETLDVSGCSAADYFIDMIIKYHIPLKKLIIKNCQLNQQGIEKLTLLARGTSTIIDWNVSGTNLPPEELATLIMTIAQNGSLNDVSLRINSLGLTSGALLPLYREFLKSPLDKWKAISLANNNMTVDDLNDISPLFVKMTHLEELSIAKNFKSATAIDRVLHKLLRIPKLKKLDLSDSLLAEHLNSMLEKIPSKETLESLDISGNTMA